MSAATLADRAALAIGRQLASPAGLGGLAIGAAMRLANRRPTRALIDALDIRSQHRVLDVGCGDGDALKKVGHAGWRCGIDQSATMIESARRRMRREIATGRVSVRHGNMAQLPFGPKAFDRILASNILYFCADVPAFVGECRRIARTGAKLGIYVTDRASMANWRFAGAATHRHFSRDELRRELLAAQVADDDMDISPLPLPGGMSGLIAIVRL